MAIAHVQSAVATNTLAQTFTTTYGATPSSGNLLVAMLGHDEVGQDISTITSAGWVRQATFDAIALTPDGRLTCFAKIAGASEATAVDWDLGEANRRAHGYALEYSGFVESIADAGAANKSGGEDSGNVTSVQTAGAINIRTDGLGIAIAMGFGSGLSAFSFDVGLTTQIQSALNFRGSAVGWIEAGGSLQPTASWTGSRPAAIIFVEIAATLAPTNQGSPILII